MAYAMIDKGITPPPIELVYDGTIQRFKKEGDDKPNSWYVGYRNGDFETGAFGCWKLGVNETFCSKDSLTLLPQKRRDYAIKQSEMRKLQES